MREVLTDDKAMRSRRVALEKRFNARDDHVVLVKGRDHAVVADMMAAPARNRERGVESVDAPVAQYLPARATQDRANRGPRDATSPECGSRDGVKGGNGLSSALTAKTWGSRRLSRQTFTFPPYGLRHGERIFKTFPAEFHAQTAASARTLHPPCAAGSMTSRRSSYDTRVRHPHHRKRGP